MVELIFTKDFSKDDGEQLYDLINLNFLQYNFLQNSIINKVKELEEQLPKLEKEINDNRDRNPEESFYEYKRKYPEGYKHETVEQRLYWNKYQFETGSKLLTELKKIVEAMENGKINPKLVEEEMKKRGLTFSNLEEDK